MPLLALLSGARQWYVGSILVAQGKTSLPRFGLQFVFGFVTAILLAVCGVAQNNAQSPNAAKPTITIQNVSVFPTQDGPAVEIQSSAPVTPLLRVLSGPLRLVIDLPDATIAVQRKRISYASELIRAVRIDQFQAKPPVARVVVDLLSPVAYSWASDGKKLVVRLQAKGSSKAPSVAALIPSAQPAAVPVSPGNSGTVVQVGRRMAAGTSLTAGDSTSIFRLAQGGEVRVCPRTTVSLTPAQNGHDLMLGMSTGSLETHYALGSSADSILTPDFRILLAGPGEFNYAISVDSRGNTCVRTLPGNTASVIVSELMGDGTYQVKPSEQVVFRSGQLGARDSIVPMNCGCPAPRLEMLRASTPTGSAIPDTNLPAAVNLAPANALPSPSLSGSAPTLNPPPSQVTLSVAPPQTPALPAPQPNDVHVQVDAPFVFRASDPPPAFSGELEQLPVMYVSQMAPLPAVALPPPPKKEEKTQTPHRGFFGKIKGFFAAIFH
jgi:hypothetical protein